MADKDFDDILISLGTSKWNFMHYLCVSLTGLMMPTLTLNGVFSAPNIDHKCKPNISEGITYIDKCHYTDSQNETHVCNSWEYDSELFPQSMTEEFNLVCERAYLRPTYQTSYMVGNFIGAVIIGFLADRFGRQKLIIVGSIILVSTGMVCTFLSNIILLIIFRFVMGLCHSAARTTGYILCLEICEPKYRTVAGVFLSMPWALGAMWYGTLGYLVRDWRWLQRLSLIPGFTSLFFLKYICESPRWLIVNGKFEEAMKTIRFAAKENGAILPREDDMLKRMQRIQESSLSKKRSNKEVKSKIESLKYVISCLSDLFKTPVMRKIVLLMYYLFFAASLVYYGLTFNATNFNLNPYMYMIVGGAVEIPPYSIIVPVVNKFGRIPPTVFSYMCSGVVVLILSFISNEPKWIVITLAMTGKLLITASFKLIYLIGMEVYPTEVRMQGIGTSQMISRIGSIAAPYITDSFAQTYSWVPTVIFGITSLLAGIVSYFVPETINDHLPETVKLMELKYSKKNAKKAGNLIEDETSSVNKCYSALNESFVN